VRPGPVIAGALCIVCVSCERSPLDFDCPELDVGDLVVTEVRGPQSGEDIYGDWIELYNASGSSVSVRGMLMSISRLDGSSFGRVLVREPLSMPAGEFAVLGRQPIEPLPGHVDYGYIADFDSNLFDTGAIQLYGCDRDLEVDRAIYRNLPSTGTFGIDGAIDPPTADDNDDETAWCVDDEADANSATDGIRGTPQERNRECI
jgi:hypothetical protein